MAPVEAQPHSDGSADVPMTGRQLVLISGAPGAGKSTLAFPLAAELGMPLITKDVIKETLHDIMGPVRPDPWDSSRAMGAAAMELMWRLGAMAPRIVLEANFRHAHPVERDRITALSDTPVEVYCRVPPEVAAARFAARNSIPDKHPVHVASSMPLDWFEHFQQPMGLGPVLEVDTTASVDVAAVARWVSEALG